jgi:hypothetical protein
VTIATLNPNSETQPVDNQIQIEEILANVAVLKAVFLSAKGPKGRSIAAEGKSNRSFYPSFG